jgi:acetolactate synthase-1/2/3 large subunit
VYFPQLEIVGDIKTTVNRLAQELELNNCSLELLAFRKCIKQVIHEKDNDASYPLLPQRIVADVRRGLDKDAIIALDNGMYKIWFARHYHTYMPNTVLLDNALATMGITILIFIFNKIRIVIFKSKIIQTLPFLLPTNHPKSTVGYNQYYQI